ncbi:hypothetical protein DYQ94_06525 [Xanthomonas sp. LMG 8993]|nr:hypothetical protein [Xanthomonas sp. LMG 8993]
MLVAFSGLVLLGVTGIGGVLALYLKGVFNFGTTVTISTSQQAVDLELQQAVSDLKVYAQQLRNRVLRDADGSDENQASVLPPEAKASLNKVHIYYSEAVAAAQRNISYVERRSQASLVMGTVATLLAFVVIWVLSVKGSAIQFDSWASFAFHFIPRATLAIFIEIFAFFFLRLHRQSLSELRACNTDLRELSLKYGAIELVWDAPDVSARRVIAESLVSRTASPSLLEGAAAETKISMKDVAEIISVIAKRVE